MKGEKLDQLIHTEDLHKCCLNLIKAPCGSGKTYFAKSLKRLAVFDKMLYLIDTKTGKDQLLEGAEKEWINVNGTSLKVVDGITFMTYAGFAKYCDNSYVGRQRWTEDAVIICDEFHNAIKWSKWANDNNLHRRALDLLRERIMHESNLVIAISATPNRIRKEFSAVLHDVPVHGEPLHYENGTVESYTNLEALLQTVPQGQRGIVYIQRITHIENCMKVMSARGFRTAAVWSTSNKEHPLSKEQMEVRDYIIKNAEIPPNIDILFLNASGETSINIGNKEKTKYPIDFMIVHNTQSDVQEQVRGRYRNDLDRLYLYKPLRADDMEKALVIPERYLNEKLTRKDIIKLIWLLGIRDDKGVLVKPPKFKELLIDTGYQVQDGRTNKIRYVVILENSDKIVDSNI